MVRNTERAYKKVVINDVNPVTFMYMMTTEVRMVRKRPDQRGRGNGTEREYWLLPPL